jgi:hypothetical protein
MTKLEDFAGPIETARLAVESLPQHLQGPAFSAILERLLGHGGSPPATTPANAPPQPGQPSAPPVSMPPAHAVKDRGSRRQQVAWALVTLANRSELATPDAVMRVIKDGLGATPPTAAHTSTELKEMTPRYANRTKVGHAYAYTPTPSVGDVFDGLADE